MCKYVPMSTLIKTGLCISTLDIDQNPNVKIDIILIFQH